VKLCFGRKFKSEPEAYDIYGSLLSGALSLQRAFTHPHNPARTPSRHNNTMKVCSVL